MRTTAASVLLWLGCGPGPLPPESPKTELDHRAAEIPILVETAAEREAALSKVTPAPASQASVETAPAVVFANVGLSAPTSVIYEPASDSYLVGNLSQTAGDSQNRAAGYISKLSPDGSVTALRFIAGSAGETRLFSPSGLGLLGDTLLVTDVDYLRSFSLTDGRAIGSVHFPDATKLSALAIADGVIYVADQGPPTATGALPMMGTLYKLEDGKTSLISTEEKLHSTSGLVVVNNELISVSSSLNQLNGYGLDGSLQTSSWTLSLPGTGAEGLLALPDHRLLVSSSGAKTVFVGRFSPRERAQFTQFASVESPAQLGYDSRRGLLLLALSAKNEVRAVPAPSPVEAEAKEIP